MIGSQVKQITIGFVALGVGLTALGAILLRAQGDLVETSGQVAHSREVTGAIESVNSVSMQSASLLRDYVLSRSAADKDSFRQSRSAVLDAVDRLRKLTSDNPPQLERADKLRQLYQDRVAHFEEVLSAVDQRSSFSGRGEASPESAMKEEEAISRTTVLMKAEEEKRLDARLKRWNETSSWTQVASFLLVVFNLAILLATFFYLRREATKRERSELQLIEKNRELNDARDQALRASLAKGRFLADMSHEIRTPLNGVIAMTSLLVESDLSPKDQQHVETILDSSSTLLRIVNDLLDLSKIEAERLELVPKPTLLLKVLRDVEALYQGRAQQNDTTLRLVHDIDPELTVLVDEVRLKQILGNLVGNAVKFTRHGDVTLSIASRPAHAESIDIEFRCTDNGPGIPPDQVQFLFDAFQHESDLQRELGGTGLGLSIAQRLANLMESNIEVDTEVGRGSQFTFRLKLAIAEAVPVETVSAVGAQSTGARVLLAEDNTVNVLVATTLLESLGCEVTVAWNGQEAVELHREQAFDMVLMDMRMPVLDGPEATRAIRRGEQNTGKRIPVVAVTANAFADDRRVCFEAGMDDFLSKPFTLDSLREVIFRWASPVAA